MSIEQQLEEAKATLAAANHRSRELGQSIAYLKAQLQKKEEELRKLVGSGWGHSTGEIGRLKGKVASLELKLAHSKKPKVVWADGRENGYIVHKVTDKRIYVCSPGNERCDMYHKDGKPVSSYGSKIDIEATFGGPCPDKMK